MERIKQALERARAEREAMGVGDAAPAPAPRDNAPRAEPAGRAPPAVGVKVAYTKTRTLTIDPERLRQQRIVIGEEQDPIVDAYKVLRTQTLQRMRTNGWNALAVTSPNEDAGKTVTAINLAISLAREVNQTVLLADLDLRRPSVVRYFTDEEVLGVSDYLLEERELAEILINPGIERLVILPGHGSFTHSSEMLSTPRMVSLVEELKTRYPDRILLFDMPPLFAGDDVIAFSPYLDAVMLVVEDGKTAKDDLRRAWELLGRERMIGVVVNKAEGASSAYGHPYS
jgi:capsular exopolysaccharide synthesis family protein